MRIIKLTTKIAAPIERCFLLSLSIDLHKESAKQTAEQAIDGVTQGIIGPGQTVTWRGRHFGFMLTQETKITRYERPRFFQDVMIRGLFANFIHDHHFEEADGLTSMQDVLRFSAPLRVLGLVAERVVLDRYLERFLLERNATIKRVAESQRDWIRYIEAS